MTSLIHGFKGASGVYGSALDYYDMGFSIIPCRVDKRPAIPQWAQFQAQRVGIYELDRWFATTPQFRTGERGQGHPSIGVLCGKISRNLVVIDLDGIEAVKAFYAQFPHLSGETLTVKTGSGNGVHLYFQVNKMPQNINVRVDDVGGFEMRGNGQYVIAPPSPHPSGNVYETVALREIAQVHSLLYVYEWFESMRANHRTQENQAMVDSAKPVDIRTVAWKKHYLESVVSQEIARVETASTGNRNNSLFTATRKLANYCAGGELSRYDIEARLLAAASKVNMPPKEAEGTIQSGFNIGLNYPKQVPPAKV